MPHSAHSPAPVIRAFFDQPTNTISYLVADPVTHSAVVIDPVLDFDQRDGTVDVRSVEAILAAAKEATLTLGLPERGIEPIERNATRGPDGYWHVRGVALPLQGRWHIRIEALVTDFEKVTLEDDVDVR